MACAHGNHGLYFQISDHSKECTEHTDPLFSRQLHTSCSVHGGDGLAFVLHRDPAGASAVGSSGTEMGYGGLKDSLSVRFDEPKFRYFRGSLFALL